MRPRLALLALVLAGTVGGTASAQPDLRPAADFRLADGTAACRFDAGALSCRTRSFGSAVRLARTGTAVVEEAPLDWSRRTPVLRRTWRRAGIVCTAGDTFRCTNRSGTLLVVGARAVTVLAQPAVSP